MKIPLAATMSFVILFTGIILCSCPPSDSSLPTKEFVVTATQYFSSDNSLAIGIPKAVASYYTGSRDMKQLINFQALITVPGHSITDGEIRNGGMRVTVSPPLNQANPDDTIVRFNTDLIFYECSEGLFDKSAVTAKCRIITPSITIQY
jgi:hypothetical protein